MVIFCQKLNCPQNSFTCSKKHFKNVSFLTGLHPHPMSALRVGNYAKLLNFSQQPFYKKAGVKRQGAGGYEYQLKL